MKNFSLLEAVELALQMEEEGIRFYTQAAGKVQESGMKEFLIRLRDMEYSHVNAFRGLYSEISGREGSADADLFIADPELGSYFRAYVESTVFPVKGAADGVIARLSGVQDILKLGMQFEKESILYYQELSHHAPYPQAAEVLKKIISEERGHFRIIHAAWKEHCGK